MLVIMMKGVIKMPVKQLDVLPFAMRLLDLVPSEERGYDRFDQEYPYDATNQVSYTIVMGGTLVLTSPDKGDSDTKSDSEDD